MLILSALMKTNLILTLTNKNREALKNHKELWSEIKDEIETIRGIEPIKYEKDFMIRFLNMNMT